jgi:hypothetical protein
MLHILNSIAHFPIAFLIDLAIVVFAAMAAWRLKVKGLWVLTAAAFLTSLHNVVWLVGWDPSFSHSYEQTPFWMATNTFTPVLATVVSLIGWALLALGRKRKEPLA